MSTSNSNTKWQPPVRQISEVHIPPVVLVTGIIYISPPHVVVGIVCCSTCCIWTLQGQPQTRPETNSQEGDSSVHTTAVNLDMLDEERGPEEDRLDGLDSGAPADASQGGGLPCR